MSESTRFTRRVFTLGLSSQAILRGSRCHATDRAPSLPDVLVDTHLHCFAGRQDKRFPYHPQAPYRPEEAATPTHLLNCMDGAGVDHAVVVHPEPYQDDHRYLLHCLALGKGRLKGTILLFADRPGSLEKMPMLAKDRNIVAMRVHAYAADRLPPFGKPEFRQIWSMASDLGLAVQLHFEPRYAPQFEPMIREFKDVTHIVDHMGRPFQGTPKEHSKVLGWSRFPNVVMKLAAIPQRRNYPHRDIRPVIRQLTSEFGANRLICGGGFGASATPTSYRATFERTRRLIDHLSFSDQARVLGENATNLFGFA